MSKENTRVLESSKYLSLIVYINNYDIGMPQRETFVHYTRLTKCLYEPISKECANIQMTRGQC